MKASFCNFPQKEGWDPEIFFCSFLITHTLKKAFAILLGITMILGINVLCNPFNNMKM